MAQPPPPPAPPARGTEKSFLPSLRGLGSRSEPSRRRGGATLALLLTLAPIAAHADVRSIVIGVDKYQHEIQLSGAVNDAKLVASAIKPLSQNLIELTDTQVTRPAVLKALDGDLAASKPGDTIFISYSGHGGRERVRVTPATPTGFREFWVMVDFDRRTPDGISHRIISTEIGDWIARAHTAGVRVVLLADHCYAGKIYRDVGVDSFSVRSIPLLTDPDVPPGEKPPKISELAAAPPPPGLVSLAADRSDTPVTEFRMSRDGEVHGALSFVFATALLQGRNDLDPSGHGRITIGALTHYVQHNINLVSEGQQQAQLRTGDPEDADLFAPPAQPAAVAPPSPPQSPHAPPAQPAAVPPPPRPAPPPAAAAENPADAPLALAVTGMPPADAKALVESLAGTVFEPDPAHARLVWEVRPGASRLVTGQNLFVSFDMPRETLPAAVENIRVADQLATRAQHGKLSIDLTHANNAATRVYFSGEGVRLGVSELPGPNLVVVNLAAEGTVQFLYPRGGDAPIAWPTSRVNIANASVSTPFGGDHVVAIASTRSLANLIVRLRALDDSRQVDAAMQAITLTMDADPTAEIAVAGLFTVPAELRCDPEVIRDEPMYDACHGGNP